MSVPHTIHSSFISLSFSFDNSNEHLLLDLALWPTHTILKLRYSKGLCCVPVVKLQISMLVWFYPNRSRNHEWFSPGTPVSSINKTDRHYIAEILLKVALNTITLIRNHDLLRWRLSMLTVTQIWRLISMKAHHF
jgi:hypothetical protein